MDKTIEQAIEQAIACSIAKERENRFRSVYIIWPEERWVGHRQMQTWFADAVANKQIAPERLGAKSTMEMAHALSDAGIITVRRPK